MVQFSSKPASNIGTAGEIAGGPGTVKKTGEKPKAAKPKTLRELWRRLQEGLDRIEQK